MRNVLKSRWQLLCCTGQLFCCTGQLLCCTGQLLCCTGQLLCCTGLVVCSAALVIACGGDPKSDPTNRDAGQTDGANLWRCTEPGQRCNAHDACAIDPVCGDDHLCRPRTYQNCDDGLDCTADSCGGGGLCVHKPQSGFCVFGVVGADGETEPQCIPKGTSPPEAPCKICLPDLDTERWSPRDGGTCDDGQACTTGDRCVDGRCMGDFYGQRCDDGLTCTVDSCDGAGGCDSKQQAASCIIDRACVAEGGISPDGCQSCNPKVSQDAWTPLEAVCNVGGICIKKGQRDETSCGICDPETDPAGWSSAPDRCFVEGRCVKAGDRDPVGCGICIPERARDSYLLAADQCEIGGQCYTKDALSPDGCGICDPAQADRFSPISSATKLTADFESPVVGLLLDPPVEGVGWRLSDKRPHGGTQSLYYGDADGKTYDNGKANAGAATLDVKLTAHQRAALAFWVYLDVENASRSDLLRVEWGSQVLWQKGYETVPNTSYRQWLFVQLDLSPYAGTPGPLRFRFDTKDDWDNAGQGIFIDDIAILSDCGPR